jgi:uncharacterized membrane protein
MRIKITMAAQVLLLSAVISGCFSFKGGDETVIQQRSPSTERELADLKAAYDRGIISQQEYNQQRDRLLGRWESIKAGEAFLMRMTILLLCGAVFLSGCISISSGERTVREETATTATLGQQLLDLKADYDQGRISQQEYNQRRDRLLGKWGVLGSGESGGR